MTDPGTVRDKAMGGLYTALSFQPFSRLMGRTAALRVPRPLLKSMVRAYCRWFNVDMSDVLYEDWHSFNDFFTRRLKPESRPVDPDPNVIVSPADGIAQSTGTIKQDTALQVKGMSYSVSELLGDPDQARRFEGGTFYTVYLRPADYHRVHAPVTCRIVSARHIPGRLFSVNPKVTRYCNNLLSRNERVILTLETKQFGEMVLAMVGATGVGGIEVHGFPEINERTRNQPGFFAPRVPMPRKKGAEIGMFNMGSTVVLFTSAKLHRTGPQIGSEIHLGQAILKH